MNEPSRHVVLVTGARGFLGSEIVRHLRETGRHDVHVLDRPSRALASSGRYEHPADLTDESSLCEILENLQPQTVVHAAGRVAGSALELYRDNTVTTVALTNAILRCASAARLVALGSAAEYGPSAASQRIDTTTACRPATVYGHAKLAAALYLQSASERGLRYDLLRIFNVVGWRNSPNQALGAFIAQAAALQAEGGGTVEMRPLGAVRDFVTARDVARAVERLTRMPPGNEPIDVCSGRGRKMRDLVQLVASFAREPIDVREPGMSDGDGRDDVVVGRPTRFLELVQSHGLESVEETLRTAWRIADEAARAETGGRMATTT